MTTGVRFGLHLKRLLARIGLPGHFHAFRHAFISNAASEGVPEAVIRSWVGHVDAQILRPSMHIADRTSQGWMQRLHGQADVTGKPSRLTTGKIAVGEPPFDSVFYGAKHAHSTNATCASCHAKIDPLGLAFDNFDAIGRWRTHERVEGGTGDDPPVDASGTLPDGRTFAGPEEFKRLLAESPDMFARAFIEQLATYALRRVMTVDDTAALEAIAAQSKADGYRLESLIRALATSELIHKR